MTIIAMNLVNGALTEHKHFPNQYSSFARVGDRYFAGGPNGLAEMTPGGKDVFVSASVTFNNNIDASVKFGSLDFGDSRMKRVTDIYLEAESDGALNLHVFTDDDEYVYPVTDIRPPLANRKANIGKGIRTRRWQFGISNQDGANFTIAGMSVLVATMARRV